ncbi:MAG TPA: hypothetical protein VND99_00215 [Candidatus Acidoferrales bacterium]|nr:hypothetical protein [Candidatus Acidoferrales bacterium]
MAEGGIPTENPHSGLQVRVENIHGMYEFLGDENAPESSVLDRTALNNDPLLQRITSTIAVDAQDQTAMMQTQFSHSAAKLDKDLGYYSVEQRDKMKEKLLRAGFRNGGAIGDREFYTVTDPASGELGKFFIDYGPASQMQDAAEKGAFIDSPDTVPPYIRERLGDTDPESLQRELDSEMGARNRHILLGLPVETDAGEAVFGNKLQAYARVFASVGKALYATEDVPEPDKTIVLRPPAEELVIDFDY